MGFVYQRKTYRLLFEGALTGLEVTARSASAVLYRRIAGMANREWSNPLTDEDLDEFDALCDAFAGVLVEWNLEEESNGPRGKVVTKPVPATRDGLLSQDLELVTGIVLAWMDAVAGAPPDPFSEESLPMETLT